MSKTSLRDAQPGDHPVRAVLLDLDGTVLDTAPDMVAALNDLRTARQLAPLPYALARQYVSHGARGLVRIGFPDASEAQFEVLRRAFLEAYAARVTGDTRIFEGIESALAVLEAAGVPWGIVTNKPQGLTEALLAHLGLLTRAAVLVCGDTLPERKPHPAPLLHAARQLGIEPVECIYIGDAERDVQAARAAGMRVYVALFGYIPADESPLEWPASAWLDAPAALVALLEAVAWRRDES